MSTETTTPRVAVNDGSMPKVAGRFLTDHRITQLEWWSGAFDVVSPPTGSGPAASLTLAVRTVWKSIGYDLFLSANVRNAMVLGLWMTPVTAPESAPAANAAAVAHRG